MNHLSSSLQQDYLSALPTEIKLHIFSFINPTQLNQVNQVSRNFYDITNDDALWHYYLTKKAREEAKKAKLTYKACYKKYYQSLQAIINNHTFTEEKKSIALANEACKNLMSGRLVLYHSIFRQYIFLKNCLVEPIFHLTQMACSHMELALFILNDSKCRKYILESSRAGDPYLIQIARSNKQVALFILKDTDYVKYLKKLKF